MTASCILYCLSLILCQATVNGAWLLSQAGLNGSSYNVRHLSMHFSRVFLSISVENKRFPTLIEAQWPVSYLPMRTIIFPSNEVHANGDHSDCTLLQQAHWSQVDSLSRLWVMDVGWPGSECPPKLLVFDLIRNNIELLRINCGQHIDANNTQSLVVQMPPKPSSCEVERHIYFILGESSMILAYDILEQTWHSWRLISHKYENMNQTFPIQPLDFSFGLHGELLVVDQDGGLYSSGRALSLNDKSNGIALNPIQLNPLGSLLGSSRSMLIDYTGSLFYVMPKYGAVVRCSRLSNLTAEGNEIIYLTSKNIQQIFLGVDGAVWVLSDRVLKPQDICYPGLL
ncbi:uncharacterized protein Dwil_GK10596 [Drosophila willistoni]|uniref:Bee-milk protein n=1 Tax=Drosophila willistoni TaxID=7260 RepID=B4NLW1_DROWI|nr:uncharacterized protein LOC6651973 [Drosophila willistoni]EDW85413.1 uncharacterized protein Dwil_GK10596 [Drosophila willistoni]